MLAQGTAGSSTLLKAVLALLEELEAALPTEVLVGFLFGSV
jgi:hypothetical protein